MEAWTLGIQLALGWPPTFSSNSLGFLSGLLDVGTISCGYDWPEMYVGTGHSDVEYLGGFRR